MSGVGVDVGRGHATAIHQMLDGHVPYRVYLGEVTDPETAIVYPYLVVWPPPPSRSPITLTGQTSQAETVTQISAAAETPLDVLSALDRAAALLHAVTPAIDGRACNQIGQLPTSTPPILDPKVRTPDGRPVYTAAALFRLSSLPAA